MEAADSRIVDYRAESVGGGLRIFGVYFQSDRGFERLWRSRLYAVGSNGRFVTAVVLDSGDRPAPLAELRATARVAVEQLRP